MATATPTDLTDEQWSLLAPLLPPRNRRGRPRVDDRRTLNGILWVLRTGARWADLPRRYGAASTCHARLQRWGQHGVWDQVWRALLSRLDFQGRLDWNRAHLDGTFIPAKKGGMLLALLAGARAASSWRLLTDTALP
jgi:transposase